MIHKIALFCLRYGKLIEKSQKVEVIIKIKTFNAISNPLFKQSENYKHEKRNFSAHIKSVKDIEIILI